MAWVCTIWSAIKHTYTSLAVFCSMPSQVSKVWTACSLKGHHWWHKLPFTSHNIHFPCIHTVLSLGLQFFLLPLIFFSYIPTNLFYLLLASPSVFLSVMPLWIYPFLCFPIWLFWCFTLPNTFYFSSLISISLLSSICSINISPPSSFSAFSLSSPLFSFPLSLPNPNPNPSLSSLYFLLLLSFPLVSTEILLLR